MPRPARWTPLGNLALVAALVWQCAPYTGNSLNPARSLGPALLAPLLAHIWVYLVGPTAGSLLACGAFALVRDRDRDRHTLTAKLSTTRATAAPSAAGIAELLLSISAARLGSPRALVSRAGCAKEIEGRPSIRHTPGATGRRTASQLLRARLDGVASRKQTEDAVDDLDALGWGERPQGVGHRPGDVLRQDPRHLDLRHALGDSLQLAPAETVPQARRHDGFVQPLSQLHVEQLGTSRRLAHPPHS